MAESHRGRVTLSLVLQSNALFNSFFLIGIPSIFHPLRKGQWSPPYQPQNMDKLYSVVPISGRFLVNRI